MRRVAVRPRHAHVRRVNVRPSQRADLTTPQTGQPTPIGPMPTLSAVAATLVGKVPRMVMGVPALKLNRARKIGAKYTTESMYKGSLEML